jgi:hypothetical protein
MTAWAIYCTHLSGAILCGAFRGRQFALAIHLTAIGDGIIRGGLLSGGDHSAGSCDGRIDVVVVALAGGGWLDMGNSNAWLCTRQGLVVNRM